MDCGIIMLLGKGAVLLCCWGKLQLYVSVEEGRFGTTPNSTDPVDDTQRLSCGWVSLTGLCVECCLRGGSRADWTVVSVGRDRTSYAEASRQLVGAGWIGYFLRAVRGVGMDIS